MKKGLFPIVVFLGISPLAQAELAQSAGWHLGGSVGATFPHAKDDTVNSTPGWPADSYTYRDIDSKAVFAGFAGYTWERDSTWLPFYTLRANYFYNMSSEIHGNIIQYSLPEFDNYTYQYTLQSQYLLGVVKANIYRFNNIMPYASVGIGAAWNKVNNYHEQALPGISPRVSPDFDSHTKANFAYLLGAGIDYIVTDNLWLSLEYGYSHLGHAQTGESKAYANDVLETKVWSNSILFSITYYFDKNS